VLSDLSVLGAQARLGFVPAMSSGKLDPHALVPAAPMEARMRMSLVFALGLVCLLALSGFGLRAQALLEVHEDNFLDCIDCHAEDPAAIAPPDSVCIACHTTMIEPLGAMEVVQPDPHRSPHLFDDEVPVCSDCHKVHEPSVVFCTVCHGAFEFQIK
jgi:hypothetical protein